MQKIRYGWVISLIVRCRESHSYVVPGGASLNQRTEFGDKIKVVQDAKRIHVRVLQVQTDIRDLQPLQERRKAREYERNGTWILRCWFLQHKTTSSVVGLGEANFFRFVDKSYCRTYWTGVKANSHLVEVYGPLEESKCYTMSHRS
jgi:hypothetical protein